MLCTSCGTHINARENFVKFECPNCLNQTIIRCSKCKALGNEYICKNCKFIGP